MCLTIEKLFWKLPSVDFKVKNRLLNIDERRGWRVWGDSKDFYGRENEVCSKHIKRFISAFTMVRCRWNCHGKIYFLKMVVSCLILYIIDCVYYFVRQLLI